MSLREQIDIKKLPLHVAIIMDGNGRWAKQRGLERNIGHQEGVKAVREVIECAAELGMKYLTLYTFSKENWSRPDKEVAALMDLMAQALNNETENLVKNNIRLRVIGDIDRLDTNIRKKLLETVELTSKLDGLNLIVALSYSSRWEIFQAAKKFAEDYMNGKISPTLDDENIFGNYLLTAGIPDPELMIRTSGEMRISNFLLWQMAYTELYFTDILWPDFRKEHFYEAIIDYQKRERRFGKTSEQIMKNGGSDED
ncbi:MAG TPA: isoprenyl transferase [Bacteroidales bacterium]|nr:isoprenyl transferase [Bacteroidales bacterium]HOM40929.1 isoprenyl transferase [Bacteroidales bacterium]HPP91580.1 isoprenyl transferase [Bacteroidales bacterium]HRR16335.1 isoprenyl transferase [Bacteroidales bacterium]HRT47405.1 isoprenyl transferase [Bacteroidales bacterium]